MNVICIADFMTGVDKVRYLVCTLYHLQFIAFMCYVKTQRCICNME